MRAKPTGPAFAVPGMLQPPIEDGGLQVSPGSLVPGEKRNFTSPLEGLPPAAKRARYYSPSVYGFSGIVVRWSFLLVRWSLFEGPQ